MGFFLLFLFVSFLVFLFCLFGLGCLVFFCQAKLNILCKGRKEEAPEVPGPSNSVIFTKKIIGET